ncbi:MAG: hypothetical protein IKO85_00895 [Bacteroidaceae bacterium]|nr:hypothetical protein [Bacteroidaceae bacterium]
MNLNKEQREQLEQMGYMLIPPQLAAINLEMDELEFLTELKTVGSEVQKAYYSGYIRELVETRQAIVKAAHNGSNPAQVELLRLINRMQNAIDHA